jgi:hypothetical protein
MDARFANREGFRIVKCPESMNPNAESLAKMGERISTGIRSNDAMRARSIINVSMRTVC